MKTKIIFYLLTMTLLFQISCNSTKNIALFQEMKKENSITSPLPSPPRHIIQKDDNLYVNILTLDPSVNELFNPGNGGNSSTSNTQYMYGTPAGQYINGYRVNESGTINIPIIGEVNVINQTLEEAESIIRKKAEEYLKEPTVHVKLLNYKIEIMGEVMNPNLYYNYEGTLNIFEAIGLANGITLYADLKNVIVNRKIGNKTQTFKIDITNNNIYKSEVYYLHPNDMIYIPPTNLKRRREDNSTFSIILSTVTTIIAVIAVTK